MVYDIAIIGAGPAGSTFARLLAGSGYQVILIDGQTEANKKPCGGLLAPDAQKALAHFDLVLPKSVLVDPQIFSVKTIHLCRKQVRYYPRHYLNIDRYAFDRWLESLVPPCIERCKGRCLKVKRNQEWLELTVYSGGEEKSIRARQLVGADGANSLIRRTFFRDDIMRYVAIQQWFRSSGNGTSFYSCVFDEKTSESCSWSICKDGYFLYGGCFSPDHCRDAFEKQKQRFAAFQEHSFGEYVKTEACLALRPRRPRDFQTGRDGVYLIGEAAGFISPSSFEGISQAIISGKLLAEAFLKYRDPGRIAASYHRKTGILRAKLTMKMAKRWFMYTPFIRYLIMKAGMGSIDLWR